MNRTEFANLAATHILVLDGATGTELIKRGLVPDVCPEKWILEHPDAIIDLQSKYIQAGSNIIYTPTFGVNRHKLANFGLQDHVVDMNRRLVALSKKAAEGTQTLVFGDMAPTGLLVEPCEGGAPFENVVNIYKEQAQALLDAGVDGFAIETMLNVQEARAALIAVRELSSTVPVICTMTFEHDGRTLTGTPAAAAIVTLQALGADAVGCNCSAGPEDMATFIQEMYRVARVPIVAKPNAGLPKIVDGKTKFDMDADSFAQHIPALVNAGASLIGGCCGTTPEHIRRAAEMAKTLSPKCPDPNAPNCISSQQKILEVCKGRPFAIIGERINPTGKKALQAELRSGNFSLLRSFAREQEQKGAAILDVNLGMTGINEQALMRTAVAYLTNDTPLPLCIDTTHPEIAETALRLYPGRAIFNSISAESDRLEKVLPIVAKYGAMIIVLPLDDKGIPNTLDERKKLVDKVFDCAEKFGCTLRDVIVDGLAMTVSANPEAAQLTLDLIEWASSVKKVNTVCGLSNISFGLPRRDIINRTFLGMAIGRGLNMAIANPMIPGITETTLTTDLLSANDPQAVRFIGAFADTTADAVPQNAAPAISTTDKIRNAVINGDKDALISLLDTALTEKIAPKTIVDTVLIPAITAVGDKYERKEFFLPQLLAAANAMRTGMDKLLPLLTKAVGDTPSRGKFILATVQGDIHDIGKNIVSMMLGNYGFDVIDLGKDVPAADIIDAAVQHNAGIIGLSALMTTTMVRMKDVIDLARSRGLGHLKFIVGGAVVDQAFADSIGASYAADAMGTVRLAQQFMEEP